MKEYGSSPLDNGSKPEKKEASGSTDKIRNPLEKLFEKENHQDAAEKIAKSETIWQRLTGEKPAVNTEAKPDKTAPSVEQGLADEGIILSHEQQHEIASEYIDLRREAVATEAADTASQSAEAAAVGADSELLSRAREQLNQAEPAAGYAEAIDAAYAQTTRELEHSPAGPSPEANDTPDIPLAAEQATLNTPLPPQVEMAYRRATHTEAAVSSPGASPAKPESPLTSPDWYYAGNGQRWYYPRSNPPRAEKSMLDKVSDAQREHSHERQHRAEVKQQIQQEMQTVESYIDTKEQAVRDLAAKQFANPNAAPAPRAEMEVKGKAPTRAEMPETTATQLMPLPPPAERAVSRAPSAEMTVPTAMEYSANASAPEVAERRAEHARLSDEEVVEVSRNIIVDGTSLYSAYEAKRITEPGLRHVVDEYLRGGDVKRALTQEILAKEMTYERDPQLRDRLAINYGPAEGGKASTADTTAPSPSPATTDKPDDQPPTPLSLPKLRGPQVSTEQLIIRAWVAGIVVLAIIAVVLLFR